MKNCSQPITTRKTKKSEIKTKRSGVNSRDSIIEVFCSHRKKKKKKQIEAEGKEFLRGKKTLGLPSPPRAQRDERAKLRVLTRYKTRYNGQRETKNGKTGTARGKKLHHNLIKLLQLGFRLVVMRYAQSPEFGMKLKKIPESWGARPPRPSQLFLSARFTETCHTSSSSTGTKAVDEARETKAKQRRQKAIEGERRGGRMKKKEEGKEELRRTEEGGKSWGKR